MKTKLDKNLFSLIGSLVMLIGVVGGFYYMWQIAQPTKSSVAVVSTEYKIVDLGDTLTQATTLLASLRSQATLPVTAPTADLVGKDNPFIP